MPTVPAVIGAFEAKNKFSELLDRVSRGEEIVITRHDLPVARLAPVEPHRNRQALQLAVAKMRELRKGCLLNPPGTRPRLRLQDLIREGRKY